MGCDFDCYESNDKCIFHYDKKDWLTPRRKEWNIFGQRLDD